MGILIKSARVIDPACGRDETADIYIKDGKIFKISQNIKPSTTDDVKIIDASNLVACPGLIDMHCHLREPGFEYKEDIESGTSAAALGGFTTVACMANTDPVIDSVENLENLKKLIKEKARVNVLPIVAATKGLSGEELTDYKALKKAGAAAISDDGRYVQSAGVMMEAIKEAKEAGLPIISHCEDMTIAKNGAMNAGALAENSDIPGIPNAAEDVAVARELMLAKSVSAPIHIAHISTQWAVNLVRLSKILGLSATGEATPHHFSMTEDELKTYGPFAKVSPPLRTKDDVKAVIDGLCDGTIEVIATDHAPHSMDEKRTTVQKAPNGISGFETALAAAITALEKQDCLSLSDIIKKMTVGPAGVLKIDKGTLAIGADADVTIFDPQKVWEVDTSKFTSKGKNTPFDAKKLRGKVVHTIISGEMVVENGELVKKIRKR